MIRNRSFFALSFLIALVLSPAGHARDWYEYKSKNFTVYSDVSEKRTEELLRELERFRLAVLQVTGLPDQEENQRLRVFYLNSSSEFKKFTGERRVAGFYHETWDGPLIFSKKGSKWGMPGTGIMFHEYVHHMMRSRGNTRYPMWYSEGFAELMASAEFDNGRVTLGRFPQWRSGVFTAPGARPLSVSEVLVPDLESDSGRYWDRFYGSAWFLTHYLQFGARKEHPEYANQTLAYIAAVNRGGDPIAAFEPVFGITPEEMDQSLNEIRRNGRLAGISFKSPEYTEDIPRKKLAKIDTYYLLADKALDLGDEELAQTYLERALDLSPDWGPALSLKMVLENHQEDTAAKVSAAKRMDALLTREVTDYRTAANISHYYVDQLQDIVATGQSDHGLQMKAVKWGEKAVLLNPEFVPALRYLWMAQTDRKNPATALKTMMSAFEVDPGSLYVNQTIAFYLVDAGRLDLAQPFLERVVSWSHPGRARKKAKGLLDKLARERASENQAAADTPEAAE